MPLIPGITTEADLDRAYPQGPQSRLTFPTPFIHSLGGRTFEVDRVISYGYASGATAYGNADKYQYIARTNLEVFTLFIFFRKGTMQAFTIRHEVRRSAAEPWLPGRFNTVPPEFGDEFSPHIRAITERYICGRGLDYVKTHGADDLLHSENGRIAGCPQEPVKARAP